MSSTPYDRQTGFALFSAENPLVPHSGATLDAEFNAVKIAMDDTQQNLARIQDDDGVLARGSVGQAQFDASVSLGFGAPSGWTPSTAYDADVDTVFFSSKFYICTQDHVSGVTFDPSKWEEIADFTLAAVIDDGSITSSKLAPGAVTADKIGSGSISNDKLASGAVSNAKLATDAVTTPKIFDGAVTTAKILDSAVTTAKLLDDAVTADKIAPNAVETVGVVNGAVTAPKIADGAVTAVKILDGEVTRPKLNPGVYSTQAEVEAESAAGAVRPDKIRNSPGVAKAWGFVTISGGVASLAFGYNVTAVSRTSLGVVVVTFATGFTSALYAAVGTITQSLPTLLATITAVSKTATTVTFQTCEALSSTNPTASSADFSFSFMCFGDQ